MVGWTNAYLLWFYSVSEQVCWYSLKILPLAFSGTFFLLCFRTVTVLKTHYICVDYRGEHFCWLKWERRKEVLSSYHQRECYPWSKDRIWLNNNLLLRKIFAVIYLDIKTSGILESFFSCHLISNNGDFFLLNNYIKERWLAEGVFFFF